MDLLTHEKVLRSPPVSPTSASAFVEENNVNPPLCISSNSTNFHSPMNAKQLQIPLTRAKSPKLTRRKSCGDTTHPTVDEKALCSRVCHNLPSYKLLTPSSTPVKPTLNGVNRPKDRPAKPVNEPPKASSRKLAKENNSDITVQS